MPMHCHLMPFDAPFNTRYFSPYVDEYGEDDIGLRRGRPLLLSTQRWAALQYLWTSHRVPSLLTQKRTVSDRYIIGNFY